MSVTEIVISGGPCAGKTTALSLLTEKVSEWGYKVLVVPEVATMLVNGGIGSFNDLARTPERFLSIERTLLRTQVSLRENFKRLAEAYDEDVVIFYDRAEMDIHAYLEESEFVSVLQELGTSYNEVRDSYDAVVYMVSVADGAPEFYTKENNPARAESVEEALLADKRTLDTWVGHPKLKIIDNQTDFTGKVNRTLQAVANILGIPIPLEIERKYLLRSIPDFRSHLLRNAKKIEIEQAYLLSPDEDETVRVRRRSQDDSSTYWYTSKRKLGPAKNHEVERKITSSEYIDFMRVRDPARQIVKKNRYCFVYNNQFFELDEILEPVSRRAWLLEVELTEEQQQVDLPDFLDIDREATDMLEWTNAEIARG